MSKLRKRHLVAVSPQIAQAVAADVEAYASFLPLLETSEIVGAVREEGGKTHFRARLVVSYPKLGMRQSFVSAVTIDPVAATVTAESREAPFHHMKATWTIRPCSGCSEVEIAIDYALRNPLLQLALAGAMDMAVARVMTAFEARAKALAAETAGAAV